jgi:HAD superfamily hydrolase (TIGR01509 family)
MPDKVDEYIKYKKSFDKEYAEKVEIYPGIENVLKKLGSRYPLAVNTGTRRVLVSSVLNKYNIYKHFKFVVTAEDITKGKPDPESYQLAVNKLGMLPGGCLVVEDGKSGVQSAISAGCLVVGLINELTRQELEDLNCHFVIKNLSELMVPTSS